MFLPADTWPTWADKLMEWGAEQAKRRSDLAGWYAERCHNKEAIGRDVR